MSAMDRGELLVRSRRAESESGELVDEAKALVAHARELRNLAAQIMEEWNTVDAALELGLQRIRSKNFR